MLIHDIIKIRMIDLGYLPDYPYHLISDFEMCDAFLNISNYELVSNSDHTLVTDATGNPIVTIISDNDDGKHRLFDDYYLLEDEAFESEYNTLVSYIRMQLLLFINNFITKLPDWVYSYMIGSAISNSSDVIDIEDLCRLANVEVADTFTRQLYQVCLDSSMSQIHRTGENRVPTIFGEPMVIKELRTHQLTV